jgi:DNA-binding CsgD family transcriptional regulator
MPVNDPTRPLLLEREHPLDALRAALASARAGFGHCALVGGEAGIGKTTLLEHFIGTLDNEQARTRVLWGGCDALSTPHPLGPLHDLAPEAGQRLRAALASGGDRAALFGTVLDELARPPGPVVIVFEDVHWADAATLDLLRFLGRRIQRVPALLILSHRDDEASAAQLRPLFGDLPAAHVTRLVLSRLSAAAVDTLASAAARDAAGATAYDAAGIYAATGGNPFFVAEVLRDADASGVPATVRDAVLGRAARLAPAAHEVLQLAAIVPRAIPLAVLDAVLAPSTEAIEACIAGGLLLAEGHTLRFRHELARVAVEQAIGELRAAPLHARVLAVLAAAPAGSVAAAQLAHHAQRAGDADAVLRFAPAAAREAARRGARREAAAHCRAALAHADRLADDARAALLDDYATHCFETNDLAAAITAREQAIALFARGGNLRAQCEALAAHAMPLVRALRNAEADAASRAALALAEQLPKEPPEGRALARACATESYLRMLNRDYRDAIDWGERAIELAQPIGEPEILARAHNTVGAALMFVDYMRGCAHVLQSLEIARTLGDGGVGVADAWLMLGSGSGELCEFDAADKHLAEGIAFAHAHDLDRVAGYMEGWQALCDLYRGRWDAAGQRAHAAAARETGATTNRITALLALGRLRTRRGDPGATVVLDEALVLAERSGTLQRLAPVCSARAEAAWLAGDAERAGREAACALDLARAKGHPWFVGELALWCWRAGALAAAPPGCAAPFQLQIDGQCRAAAEAWAQIGCPYEQARALADGDEAAQREALAILDRLRARPLAERIRADMRAAGTRAVPRGPQTRTLGNAAGLTARELEVLTLVARGWRNAQIATQLSRSTRTIDHHVEAILAKLGAATRAEALTAAQRLGVLPKNG